MIEGRGRTADLFLKGTAMLPMVGLAFLAVLLLMGFEEVTVGLLALVAGSILAPPLTVVLHLVLDRRLPGEVRLAWVREFRSPAGIASASMRYLLDARARGAGPGAARSQP